MSGAAPLFSVVLPTRGDPTKLSRVLDALSRQTLPRDRFEVLISFDGVAPDAAAAERLARLGARVVESESRRGPGAARNLAARAARGEYLAFTEDDCTPEPDWLERAAARVGREPAIDVLEGETFQPDGSPTRRRDGDRPHYLPTNLFVRRSSFERAGGYHEGFFDVGSGVYFREDSDFGFTLEEMGAGIVREPSARVVHPREHPGLLDPWRWARRYEMDALLRTRHPGRFHDRIEIHRFGPFTFRRIFVRACLAYVLALASAGAAALLGEEGLAAWFAGLALAAFLPVWGKWGFNLLRLPVCLGVPFVLTLFYVRGFWRARPDSAAARG